MTKYRKKKAKSRRLSPTERAAKEAARRTPTERENWLPHERLEIAAHQRWKCQDCPPDCPYLLEADFEIDHRIPLKRGGPHTYANSRALCRDCHLRKTQREAREDSKEAFEDKMAEVPENASKSELGAVKRARTEEERRQQLDEFREDIRCMVDCLLKRQRYQAKDLSRIVRGLHADDQDDVSAALDRIQKRKRRFVSDMFTISAAADRAPQSTERRRNWKILTLLDTATQVLRQLSSMMSQKSGTAWPLSELEMSLCEAMLSAAEPDAESNAESKTESASAAETSAAEVPKVDNESPELTICASGASFQEPVDWSAASKSAEAEPNCSIPDAPLPVYDAAYVVPEPTSCRPDDSFLLAESHLFQPDSIPLLSESKAASQLPTLQQHPPPLQSDVPDRRPKSIRFRSNAPPMPTETSLPKPETKPTLDLSHLQTRFIELEPSESRFANLDAPELSFEPVKPPEAWIQEAQDWFKRPNLQLSTAEPTTSTSTVPASVDGPQTDHQSELRSRKRPYDDTLDAIDVFLMVGPVKLPRLHT
jgi:hypothetical protein